MKQFITILKKTYSMKTLIIVSAGFVLLCAGCKKNLDKEKSTITFQLKAANNYSTVSRVQGTITWTSGYAYVTDIKFEAEGECQIEGESDIHTQFSGPQRVDIFAPLTVLGTIAVPPCDYSNSKFEIALTPAAGNAALELTGTYNSTPIIFRISSGTELAGIGGNSPMTGGINYTALTLLNLDLLTHGITAADLGSATVDATGTIVISATSNVTLYNTILNNFEDIEEVEFH